MDPEPFLRRFPLPAAFAAGALLVAIGFEGGGRRRDMDVSVQEGSRSRPAAEIPYSVGDWLGRDVPSAAAAVALLRPIALVNRAYHNLRTGESASVLFVDCGDARDLIGHYPPVCYPAHGQTLVSAAPRDWDVGGAEVGGMRYRFRVVGGPASQQIVVDNFMVLPTGRFGRDMDAVQSVAEDPDLRCFGAAEVQVVTDGSMSDARRDEVLEALAAPIAPLFRNIGAKRTTADGGGGGGGGADSSDGSFSAGGERGGRDE